MSEETSKREEFKRREAIRMFVMYHTNKEYREGKKEYLKDIYKRYKHEGRFKCELCGNCSGTLANLNKHNLTKKHKLAVSKNEENKID